MTTIAFQESCRQRAAQSSRSRFSFVAAGLLGYLLATAPIPLSANGGTWGRTSEGLQFRKEPRVAMAKERLFISLKKIRVEYVFRNDTDLEVSTEILFPTGSFDQAPENCLSQEDQGVSGFRVWSEGYSKAVVAEHVSTIEGESDTSPMPERDPFYKWGGRDVTKWLKPLGLSRPDITEAEVRRLTPQALVSLWKHGLTPLIPKECYPSANASAKEWHRLARKAIDLESVPPDTNLNDLIGIWKSRPSSFNLPIEPYPEEGAPESEWLAMASRALNSGTYQPNWTVHEMYRWHQVFPPHKEISVTIEYTPSYRWEDWTAAANDDRLYDRFEDCTMPVPDGAQESIKQSVLAQAAALKLKPNAAVFRPWIDYVLTTANTWKGSIEEFELMVDGGPNTPVAFLWPDPAECIGPNRYRVRLKQFKPTRDLEVTFFEFMQLRQTPSE